MLIRIFYILFFSTLFSTHLSSQIYYSKRYDILNANKASFSNDIIETKTGYFVSFNSQAIANPYGGIGFLMTDSTGSVYQTKLIEDLNYTIQTGYPGSFITVIEDSIYACIGIKSQWVPEGRYDRGWLLILDNNLDTLWTKVYTDEVPHDTSILFRGFCKLNDNGYIVVGLLNPVSGTGLFRIGMFRLDSNGNLLWERRFGSGNVNFQPYNIKKTSDNGFIIGAAYQPAGGPSIQDSDPFLIKTDSLGNTEWQLRLGSQECYEEYAVVDIAKDGNIQSGSIFSDTCWGWDTWKARINLSKIGNNKSILWNKKYGSPKLYLKISKILVLTDGDIIGTGWYNSYSGSGPYVISWIIRTDSSGNEKWYREYSLLDNNDSHNYLKNVTNTIDDGFAACGTVVPVAPDTGSQDSWVLKVDSLGCEAPDQCWVGQDEIWVKTFTPDKPFVVFPNPASDKITLEFHSNPNGAEIELLTLSSQSIIQAHLSPMAESTELDVSDLKRGMYLLKVHIPGRRPLVEKIILR